MGKYANSMNDPQSGVSPLMRKKKPMKGVNPAAPPTNSSAKGAAMAQSPEYQ